MMRKSGVPGLRLLVHVLAILPFLWLIWQFSQGQLTANPIRELQLRTGKYTLNLLVLTLACTILYHLFGFERALQLRRILGLYTFVYASLHLLNFIGLDYGFNLALLREDFVEKRFILAGLAAFLVLFALAVTSTEGWKRRLGKNWKRLHRAIYAAAGLAVLHFIWQVKSAADLGEPLVYAGIIALLLIFRIPGVNGLPARISVSLRSKRPRKVRRAYDSEHFD
ncbi:MAG: sulfoxide reductase heme-binding subunit YedZ [Chloroflexi bacterium]|nr:sulfoxide reductase heme-binding subunit YedZ [Chloroflexota bacterium]